MQAAEEINKRAERANVRLFGRLQGTFTVLRNTVSWNFCKILSPCLGPKVRPVLVQTPASQEEFALTEVLSGGYLVLNDYL